MCSRYAQVTAADRHKGTLRLKHISLQGTGNTFPDTIDLSESPFSAYAPEPWPFAYAPIEEVGRQALQILRGCKCLWSIRESMHVGTKLILLCLADDLCRDDLATSCRRAHHLHRGISALKWQSSRSWQYSTETGW